MSEGLGMACALTDGPPCGWDVRRRSSLQVRRRWTASESPGATVTVSGMRWWPDASAGSVLGVRCLGRAISVESWSRRLPLYFLATSRARRVGVLPRYEGSYVLERCCSVGAVVGRPGDVGSGFGEPAHVRIHPSRVPPAPPRNGCDEGGSNRAPARPREQDRETSRNERCE